MKKLIIFDYDGTLADTSPGIRYCYNTTAASMGFAPRLHREDFFGVIGASLEEGFLRLWPDMPQQLLPHAVANYRTLYAKKGKDLPAPLYEGVQQTLLQLKRMGLLLAVATLKHEQFIYDMLRTNQRVFCAYGRTCRSNCSPMPLQTTARYMQRKEKTCPPRFMRGFNRHCYN